MGDCCCDPFSGGGGGAITEVTGSGRIAITGPMGPVVNVDGSALIRRYVAGPAYTNAEFLTVQAAIDQAVADGSGAAYGGAVIEVYPGIGGVAIVPDTLPYFHIVGVGNGGNTGPFLTSLTINVRNGDVDFSLSGFGVTTLTINQPVAAALTSYVYLTDLWIFGSLNITGADLRPYVQDCHFYGAASAFNFNGRRLTVQGCEFLVDVAHTWTASERIQVFNNFLSGRPTLNSPIVRVEGNVFRSATSPILTDQGTSETLLAGNTFNYIGAGNVTGVVNKTGASAMSAGGNTYGSNISAPINVVAGSLTPRGIDADTVFVRNDFAANGPAIAGATCDLNGYENHSFVGIGTVGSQFLASNHDFFIVPGTGSSTGQFIGSGYHIHQFQGTGLLGSQFIASGHRNVNFDSLGLGSFFWARDFSDHIFTGQAGGGIGTFDCSNHQAFLCDTGATSITSRFDAIRHHIVNFEGSFPVDPASFFYVQNYYNLGIGGAGIDLYGRSNIVNARYVTFGSEGAFGPSGAAPNINFSTLGQKASITLTANATFTFTFPGVGNYILRITQDGTGGRTVTLPANARAAGGAIDLGGGANEVSVWAIYWNGTNAFISSMPDVGVGAPTVNLV